MYIVTPRTATKKYRDINPRDKLKYNIKNIEII